MLAFDTLCVTGHRPDKLWGYDLTEPHYETLKEIMKSVIKSYGVRRAYCGMALGVDQLFAQACIDLKLEGMQLELIAAVPCQNYEAKWPEQSQNYYRYLLAMCDNVVLVSDAPYNAYLMQVRNEYMVNHSDAVLAVWDGSDGGTANCIDYTNKTLRPVIRVIPKEIQVVQQGNVDA